jgi:asparagine synthase (glutamine-hydrolysing)
MCGIAGILLVGPDAAVRAFPLADALDAADAPLAHRGPDGTGRLDDTSNLPNGRTARLAFLHRRLSILDHVGGGQPMSRPGPRTGPDAAPTAVVFNGCLYNHRDLRRDLEARGVPFTTDHSDTEALCLALAHRGPDALQDFDGMFALAAWNRRCLLLARDRAGEKPLYFTQTTAHDGMQVFAFASTVPALFSIRRVMTPGASPILDPERCRRWIAFGFGPHTPYADIDAVPPGGMVMLDLHTAEPRSVVSRWWSAPPRGASSESLDKPDAIEAALDRAVRDRLDADVPLGCFLSGGIDSPLVAAAAKRHAPDLRTFTVRMPDPAYDESARAAAVAAHLGTNHTTLECDADPVADLETLIAQLGLPLGDSSLLPTAWVSRAARRHVTVVLTGDGADELFDGYARYRAAGLLRDWSSLLALLPSGLIERGADPKSRRARLARLADAARVGGWGYEDLLAIFPARHWSRLTASPAPACVNRAALDDPSRDDLASYLPDDLLRKVDTASMHVALEARAPFLARAFLAARPASPTPDHQGRKRLLRDLARRVLPPGLADAPKSGFAIPIGRWFRENFAGLGTLLRQRVLDPAAFTPLDAVLPFRSGAVQTLLREHETGVRDHSQRLYHLLVLSLWADTLRR